MTDVNPYEPPPPGTDDAVAEAARPLPPYQMHYIGFWRRLGARAIDSMVLATPTLVLLFLLKQFIADAVLRQTVVGAVSLVLGALYFIAVQGSGGQTLGKLATRIQVRMVDGAAFTYKAAVWRHSPELGLTALMILMAHLGIGVVSTGEDAGGQQNVSQWLIWVWYIAEAIVLISTTKKRAIHDFIARTVVVRKPGRRPAVANSPGASAAAGDSPGAVEPDADDADDADDPLDDRVLCPDGACIGVIDPDGLCKACGKPADWQP